MNPYSGNPAAYPANVRLITDSDAPNGANVSAASSDLADRTAWLQANSILVTGGIVSGLLTFTPGTAGIDMLSGASQTFENGATLDFKTGAVLQLESGALLDLLSGATLRVESGATIAVLGGGGVLAETAGAVRATAAAGIESLVPGGIRLSGGPTDFETFNPPRTRVIVQPLIPLGGALQAGWSNTGNLIQGPGPTGGAQAFVLPTLHNGARLTAVGLRFSVAGGHGSVPVMPWIAVQRQSLVVGASPYGSVASLSSSSPQSFTPVPASTAAWESSGHFQNLVFACNQNHTIDTTQYIYSVVVTDESGAGAQAGNVFSALVLGFDSITDMRFP